MNEPKSGNSLLKILSITIVIAVVVFGIYSYLPKEVKVNHLYLDTDKQVLIESNKLDEIIKEMENITFKEPENSLLITLHTEAKDLKDKIEDYLKEHFNSDNFATYIQVIVPSEHLNEIVNQYNVSLPKAQLIETIQLKDPSLSYSDLKDLSIHELFILLYNQNNPDLKGIPYTYFNSNQIKDILLNDLSLKDEDIISFHTNYNIKDKKLIITADLKTNTDNYFFELDPKTGTILSKTNENEAYITQEKAISIALLDANQEVVNDLEVKLKQDPKYIYYEVEFDVNQIDYDYKINAIDGSIIYSHIDKD